VPLTLSARFSFPMHSAIIGSMQVSRDDGDV
jgi:hypothetical protein